MVLFISRVAASSAEQTVRNEILVLFVNRMNHQCFISPFGGFCSVTLGFSFCQFFSCLYAYETSLRGQTHTHSQTHMLLVIPRVEIYSLQATRSLT